MMMGWLRRYWAWTTGGSWRRWVVGIGGPIMAVLVLLSAGGAEDSRTVSSGTSSSGASPNASHSPWFEVEARAACEMMTPDYSRECVEDVLQLAETARQDGKLFSFCVIDGGKNWEARPISTSTEARCPSGGTLAAVIGTEHRDPPAGPTSSALAPEPIAFKLIVIDDTSANPPDARAEVWIRGMGSWYPNLEYGIDSRSDVGPFPGGSKQEIYVYPDGRDGAEIVATFTIAAGLSSNSDRDAIHVEITDGQVEVWGAAVEALSSSVPDEVGNGSEVTNPHNDLKGQLDPLDVSLLAGQTSSTRL